MHRFFAFSVSFIVKMSLFMRRKTQKFRCQVTILNNIIKFNQASGLPPKHPLLLSYFNCGVQMLDIKWSFHFAEHPIIITHELHTWHCDFKSLGSRVETFDISKLHLVTRLWSRSAKKSEVFDRSRYPGKHVQNKSNSITTKETVCCFQAVQSRSQVWNYAYSCSLTSTHQDLEQSFSSPLWWTQTSCFPLFIGLI